MTALNRIVLVRHGETDGESSVRYYGATDVALSECGRQQVREAALALPGDAFDLVVASPLSRAWESARILLPARSVRLLEELREIDFGAWEGLTAGEICARDPIRYEDWLERRPGFEYPGGERRADFEARVERAVEMLFGGGVSSALVVVHKGVIRTIVRMVVGEELPDGLPELGGIVQLSRRASGRWVVRRPGVAVTPR